MPPHLHSQSTILKHGRVFIAKSLDSSDKKIEESIQMATTSSNFLRPITHSRRHSTVSFSLIGDTTMSLSRQSSILSRFSELLSQRPSVFSRLSFLANQSRRQSGIYSSLSDQSIVIPKTHILNYNKCIIFVIFLILVILFVASVLFTLF